MLFLLAVLFLLGSAGVIAGLPDHVLPPLARWGWWSMHLYSCALASIYADYGRFHQRALALVAVTLFYVSYPLLWDQYLELMPATPATFPWAEVFVIANVVIPVVLVTLGPLMPAVRLGREE